MRLIAILGPTASGKSALAMALAGRLNAAIVSCDSMMVYRGMDIGTAKPSPRDQANVSHYLVDILNIHDPYNAKSFCTDAERAFSAIVAEDKVPILCGGTGLYAKAILHGFTFQPREAEVARAVKEQFDNEGATNLLKELAAVDPVNAKIAENNPHRLLRYVEIVRLTGEAVPPASDSAKNYRKLTDQWILLGPPDDLRQRIEKRTRSMLQNGWIEEAERLVKQGLLNTPTASKALGYSRIADYLDGELRSVDELQEQIVSDTCSYAKRQRTWFRWQHPGANIIELTNDLNQRKLLDNILDKFQNSEHNL